MLKNGFREEVTCGLGPRIMARVLMSVESEESAFTFIKKHK